MADNTVGFTNQGTLDWTQLATRLASFSIAALARYSAAGVDTYTAALGRLVSTQLQLSPTGRRNVEAALAKLPSKGSYGNVLWFGFGIRHIIWELSSTDQGLSSVALCAALAEAYHEDLAAEVLHDFVRSLNAPEEYTPSVGQCKTLIHACNGAFATTDFGTLLEQMMALNPYAWHIESHEFCGIRASRSSCSSPESMAKVLVAVGAVTRGHVDAITVRGGSDAAWIAAISEWLFGLSISIGTQEHAELYKSSGQRAAQVTVLYRPHGSDVASASEALEVTDKVYILEDASSIFRTRPLGFYVAASSGRLPWASLLSKTFGNDFDLLLRDNAQGLATAAGSCARLLRGVVQADSEVPPELTRTWTAYTTDSYGKGYINSITSWFPELHSLRASMSQAANNSFVDARARYESTLLSIKQSCGCAICCPELKNVQDNCDKFCRVVLVEAILALGHVLSQTSIQEGLYPKRLGIESFYRYQVQKRRFPPVKWDLENVSTDIRGDFSDSLGPFAFIFQKSAINNGRNLTTCIEIFTGYRYDKRLSQGSALSDNGICMHSGILHDLTDDPNIVGKLHIMPGVIEHHGRPYSSVSDSSQNFPAVRADIIHQLHCFNNVTLKVVDTASNLEIFYEVSAMDMAAADMPRETLKIKPLQVTGRVNLSQGWVACDVSQCQAIDVVALRELSKGSGFREVTIAGQKVGVFIGGPKGRTAALDFLVQRGCKTVVQADGQCLGCSLKACVSGRTLSHYFSKVAPESWVTSTSSCLLVTDVSAVRGRAGDPIL